jgi:hypothetical protein
MANKGTLIVKKLVRDDGIICIMENIFGGYYPLSLGYNCFIRRYLNGLRGGTRNMETHLFDWLGTSMWSINKLLKNGFKDAFDAEFYKLVKVTEHGKPIYTHEHYYIRALHDNPRDMKIKYTRRLERLNSLLASTHHILFIRIEEEMNGRVIPDSIRDYYVHDELHHIREFADTLLALYHGIRFTVLFISSTSGTSVTIHKGVKIITISCTEEMKWENCANVIGQTLSRDMDFLSANLRPGL